jgi:dTDP-4-amino-4,6-dideoxygalactose transaminase
MQLESNTKTKTIVPVHLFGRAANGSDYGIAKA